MSLPLSPADFNAYSLKFFKSQHTIGTATSCGGAISATEIPNFEIHNLFDKVTEAEADLGKTEFRCIYIKNLHNKEPIRNPILIIVQNTASPDDQLAIGWGTAAFGGIEQTIATESTYPINVTFTEAATRTEGAVLGVNIPPLSHKAFWVRRLVSFGAAEHPQNGGIVRVLSDNVVEEVINEDQIPEPDEDSSFTGVGEFDDYFTMKEIFARIRGRNANMNVSTGNISAATASAGNATAVAGPGGAVATAGGVTAVAGNGLMDRTRISFGKDDADNTAKENNYKNRHGLRNRYSSFQFQNVHFLFMDTSLGKPTWDDGSAQFEFVKKDLTEAAADPATDWIFVLTNRVMYASATTTEPKIILKELRDLYHPIFQEKGVHIVLQGDFHNYQRTFPLNFNAADSNAPIHVNAAENPNYILPPGKTAIENTDTPPKRGCIFIVDGTGGRIHHNIPAPASFIAPNAFNATDWGYMVFFLKNDKVDKKFRKLTGIFYKMELETKKLDNEGKKKEYKFKADRIGDKFTIIKNLL